MIKYIFLSNVKNVPVRELRALACAVNHVTMNYIGELTNSKAFVVIEIIFDWYFKLMFGLDPISQNSSVPEVTIQKLLIQHCEKCVSRKPTFLSFDELLEINVHPSNLIDWIELLFYKIFNNINPILKLIGPDGQDAATMRETKTKFESSMAQLRDLMKEIYPVRQPPEEVQLVSIGMDIEYK